MTSESVAPTTTRSSAPCASAGGGAGGGAGGSGCSGPGLGGGVAGPVGAGTYTTGALQPERHDATIGSVSSAASTAAVAMCLLVRITGYFAEATMQELPWHTPSGSGAAMATGSGGGIGHGFDCGAAAGTGTSARRTVRVLGTIRVSGS